MCYVITSNTSGHETSENKIILNYLFFSYKKSEPIYKSREMEVPVDQVNTLSLFLEYTRFKSRYGDGLACLTF